MSFFSDSIELGIGLIHDTAGETVQYWRENKTISPTAVPADGFRRGRETEVYRIGDARDWLVKVSDLDFGSGETLPRRGDKIIYGGKVYEALPQDGEDVYRMSGFAQYRIHCKVVKNV